MAPGMVVYVLAGQMAQVLLRASAELAVPASQRVHRTLPEVFE